MIIKVLPAEGVPGARKAMMLCHDDGTPLDNQSAVTLHQREGVVSTIEVEFEIDGERIRFA